MTTTIDTFDLVPHDRTLCQQIGRALAARTAGAAIAANRLTFCEDTSSAAANLYASAMPPRAHRLSPAISITTTTAPSGGGGDDGPLRTIAVLIEARTTKLMRAVALLHDIRRWLLPSERTIVLPNNAETMLGQKVGRVIGRPATAAAIGASTDLWAIVGVEPLLSVTPVLSGLPGNATEEGEAMAQMSLIIRAYPVRVRGALEAFLVLYGPGLVEIMMGTIAVSATHCTIVSNSPTGATAIALGMKTIGQVRAEIEAVADWSTEDGDDADDDAPATALAPMSATAAYPSGGGPAAVGRNPTTIDHNLA